jgi:AraC family transcriptional regulator
VKTDYLSAVQEAIKYIELHLDEELDAQAVCAHIGFSQYHFHRIFMAMLGESVKDYVRKRRLMVAADKLAGSTTPILELALASGFDSQEAFTRAFKKMFRTTPGAYRKSGANVSAIRKFEITEKMLRHLAEGVTMQPKIIKRGRELAIGMGDSFVQGQTEEIGALWGRFVPRMHEIKNRKPYDLGVCASKHPIIVKKDGDTFIYVAAVAVENADHVPDGMVVCDIPESTFAVFTHSGPIMNIKHTCEYIWGTWLPESGYELTDTPDYELYDSRFDPKTGSGEVDIYVPIKV